MGVTKKAVRSEVRRSARMLITKLLRDQNIHKPKKDISRAVKQIELMAVPKLMSRIRNSKNFSDED